jgi:hypothetical protein
MSLRQALLAACAACAVALALAGAGIATASAGGARGHRFFGGVVADVPTGAKPPAGPRARVANLPYGGGPVMHSNRTHVIFWEPAASGLAYEPGYQSQVGTFLSRVAADSRKPTNVYSLSGQYRDHEGPAAYSSKFAGAVTTVDRLPPNGCAEPSLSQGGPGWSVCLSDAQLESELRHVIAADHLPKSMRDIYFLVLPNGMGTCETTGPVNCALGGQNVDGSFCGYHSSTPDEDVLYAVIPYNAVAGHCQSSNPRPNASTADPALSTISHEHNETVTDPLGTGFIDATTGMEDGDLCIQNYGPLLGGSGAAAWNEVIHGGHYWLQSEYSNVDGSCQPRTRPDSVSFIAPARVRAHRKLSLTGHAHAAHGRIVSYNWFFGDRRTSSRRVTSHAYARAGTFRVVLRTTDSWGNWAFAVRNVRVTRR